MKSLARTLRRLAGYPRRAGSLPRRRRTPPQRADLPPSTRTARWPSRAPPHRRRSVGRRGRRALLPAVRRRSRTTHVVGVAGSARRRAAPSHAARPLRRHGRRCGDGRRGLIENCPCSDDVAGRSPPCCKSLGPSGVLSSPFARCAPPAASSTTGGGNDQLVWPAFPMRRGDLI